MLYRKARIKVFHKGLDTEFFPSGGFRSEGLKPECSHTLSQVGQLKELCGKWGAEKEAPKMWPQWEVGSDRELRLTPQRS